MSLQNQIDILAFAMKEFNYLIQQTNCECKCTYKTFNQDSECNYIEYYIRCTTCSGVDGKCRDCDGSGKIDGNECYTCDGSGDCSKCGGDGKIVGETCDKCGGSCDCSKCDSSGVINGGDGTKQCSECSGKCYDCGGSGKIGSEKCSNCNSSGICSNCNSSGKIGDINCNYCNGKCMHCHKQIVQKKITICKFCLDTGYSLIDKPDNQSQCCQICGKPAGDGSCNIVNYDHHCETYKIVINKIAWLNDKLLCDQCGGNKCDSCKKTGYYLKPCDTCDEFEAYGLTKCINGYQKCSCCQGIAALKPTNYRCVSCHKTLSEETHDIKEHICKECAYDAYNIPLFFNINTTDGETTYSISINPLKIDKINLYDITTEDVSIGNATIKIPIERELTNEQDQEVQIIKIDDAEYNICIKNNQLCYTISDKEHMPLELEFHNVELHTNN